LEGKVRGCTHFYRQRQQHRSALTERPAVGGRHLHRPENRCGARRRIHHRQRHDPPGFIGADGFDDKEDRSTKAIYDWGGDTLAMPQDHFGKTATFTLMEFLNADVAKFVYRTSNVSASAATTGHGARLSIKVTSDVLDNKTMLVDTFSPGGKRVMQFFPSAQIQSKDTLKWSRTDVLAHRVTVFFLPDTTGAYCYIRTDDGMLSAS
jgi:hypothetical protein